MRRLSVLALSLLALSGVPLQSAAQTSEEDAVMAVVGKMFDAMRAKDGAALTALFAEDGRLVSTSTNPQGVAQSRTIPMSAFAANIAAAAVFIDEQIWDGEVRIHDNLATVWVKYALFVDRQFSHCGVDAFQLFRSTDGWKIVHVADTQRHQDCWQPPG